MLGPWFRLTSGHSPQSATDPTTGQAAVYFLTLTVSSSSVTCRRSGRLPRLWRVGGQFTALNGNVSEVNSMCSTVRSWSPAVPAWSSAARWPGLVLGMRPPGVRGRVLAHGLRESSRLSTSLSMFGAQRHGMSCRLSSSLHFLARLQIGVRDESVLWRPCQPAAHHPLLFRLAPLLVTWHVLLILVCCPCRCRDVMFVLVASFEGFHHVL